MDQVKIGKFIAERRKKQGLTQSQLAEKLSITDRAVSKWENGKAMPDSAIMLELCDALEITVNDLLNAEIVSAENYNKKLEDRLLEVARQKELSDRKLTRLAIVLAVVVVVSYILMLFALWYSTLSNFWYLIISSLTFVIYTVGVLSVAKLHLQAGYYQCKQCGHTYTPTFKAYFFSTGLGWNKLKMRCPQCKKRCTHEKVYTKD